MQEEIWKDIYFEENGVVYDYKGLYAVSNFGRVKSLNYNRTGKERILKLFQTEKGYQFIGLRKDNQRKMFRINRLVAHMFLDGYFEGAEVDHININRADNRAKNLRWVTHEENCNNPLTRKNKSKNNPNNKKVLGYSLTDTKVIILQSIRQSKKFGFDHAAICNCCNGKRKSHKGFEWFYLDDINNNKLEEKD